MARKYTKVVYLSDQNKIKELIAQDNPQLRFVKFSYVRDDRIVDLSNDTVYIDSYDESNYSNTKSCYHHENTIALAPLSSAQMEGAALYVDAVKAELAKDGTIQFDLIKYQVMDLAYGSFDLVNYHVDDVIQACDVIAGMELVSENIKKVIDCYRIENEYLSPNWVLRMWYVINHFNLYDQLDDFSNLFSYYQSISLKENQTDFFEAVGLPQEFKFRLTNYYLPRAKGNSYTDRTSRGLSTLSTTNYLYKLFETLPTICQEALLTGAIEERYDLISLGDNLYSISTEVSNIALNNPDFFCDYLSQVRVGNRSQSILCAMHKDANSLTKYDMALKVSNLGKLRFAQKANAINCDTHEFFKLVDKLDTKEGILAYLEKSIY